MKPNAFIGGGLISHLLSLFLVAIVASRAIAIPSFQSIDQRYPILIGRTK